jgi:2-C-methyl-D-erythritol 4-phosphate cytidylyltransferase/2-C-methyl-D-erythritol 2,4-cyclodiphosphate synthase
LICEEPKIGPHREAIVARLSDIMALSPSRVSIKATTSEQLGFTGRGEGIAAQAVANISIPVQDDT